MADLMGTTKRRISIMKVEHYQGSLDFPCDICNSNSYDNYHFKENSEIVFVICKDCIKKAIE